MAFYDERLARAELPQKITELEQSLKEVEPDASRRAQEEVPGGRQRLKAVLEYTTTVLGAAEPELISQSQINAVSEWLAQIGDFIQRFMAGELGWSEVDGAADALLDRLSTWPHSGGIPPSEVKEAASRFRRSAGQLLKNIEGEARAIRHQIGEQRTSADELQAKTEETKAAADSEIESLRAVIEEQKARLEAAIRDNQGQFSESQDRHAEQFREQLTESENRMAALQNEAAEAIKAQEAQLGEDIDLARKQMQEQLDEAERIVGAIATTGTIGGFQREANAQQETADWLRRGALVTASVAAVLAIWGVIHAGQGADGTDIAAKALASFVFFGIAGYLATQSGKHREREERARRRELELAAFGPFINGLPDTKQDDLVEKLADRMFGHELASKDGEKGNGITEEQLTILGQIVSIARSTGSSTPS